MFNNNNKYSYSEVMTLCTAIPIDIVTRGLYS